MFRRNNLFLAQLRRISADWNDNYRPYNFQALANIFGNFTTLIMQYRKMITRMAPQQLT